MVGLTLRVTETLGNIFKMSSGKSISLEAEKQIVGILAFEVSRLMSKVVNLWQYLTDTHMSELRHEMANSIGIQKLVSEDEDYLMDLALAEIIHNFTSVGNLVATLGKKCADPRYHDLEGIFVHPSESDHPKWYGWRYKLKKMEKRVKKMERFVVATEELHSEMESLKELEEKSMKGVNSVEFQQKRRHVKNLQEISPWMRTYDYTVRLLLRSLFTIIERIKYVGRSLCNLSPSSILCGENTLNLRRFAPLGLPSCMRGGSDSEIFTSSCGTSFRSNGDEMDDIFPNHVIPSRSVSFFNSKREMLSGGPSTLGYLALALHYSKIVVSIEKLASSPQLIGLDAREDLYNMLPFSIRRRVRANVMNGAVSTTLMGMSECNLVRILGWLSPLAHNMVRWQSERNFERQRQRVVFGTNVLLVQTLYFADRVETEVAIVELLLALNNLSKLYHNVGDPT